MKVSIIGSGRVGATLGYTAIMKGIIKELVMVDAVAGKAEGEAIDILQCMSYAKQASVSFGDIEQTANSDIVVVTAGIPRQPGETRSMLVGKNANLIADIIPQAVKVSPNCILFMVTNPLDVMTQLAYYLSGFPVSRVIGMGTVLDTARYRAHLGQEFGIDARDINAYVIGEHGDTMVPVTSHIQVKGIPLTDIPGFDQEKIEAIAGEVVFAGKKVISLKGGTVFAPAAAAFSVLDAIISDSQAILPVCTFQEKYGVCVSMPTLVGRNGAGKVFDLCLSDSERKAMQQSVDTIKVSAAELKHFRRQ